MFNERYEEKSYFAQGALEINIRAREQEKMIARMNAELKAEEANLPKVKKAPSAGFFSHLIASLRTPNRQFAGEIRK